MAGVLRRGEQDERLVVPGQRPQPAEGGRVRWAIELGEVASPELLELSRIVAVPDAQLSTRRDVLFPPVQPGRVLAQATRPDAVDQHAHAVRGRRVVVDAPDQYLPQPLHRR